MRSSSKEESFSFFSCTTYREMLFPASLTISACSAGRSETAFFSISNRRLPISESASSALSFARLSNFLHFSALRLRISGSVFPPVASSVQSFKAASVRLNALRDSLRFNLPLISMASVICLPTRMIGFREDKGSWKIMAILSPRTEWNPSSVSFVRSCPS